MTAGSVHRLAADVAWVLDGLRAIAAVPDLSCPQRVGNSLGMLARRIRWGATTETLDIIRIAERARVPGFGRQRAMALNRNGVETLEQIVDLGIDNLSEIVGNRHRAIALVQAIEKEIEITPNRFGSVHQKLATQLGIEEIVSDCNTKMEEDYEDAIVRLLKTKEEWQVTVRDDGKRKNEPDVLMSLAETSILLEHASAVMTAHFQHTGSSTEPEDGWRTPLGGDAEAGVPRIGGCSDRRTRRGTSAAWGRTLRERCRAGSA